MRQSKHQASENMRTA